MLDIYRKLYDILDARERRLTVAVFALLVLVAILETVGVASIMPFMAVLSNPDVVDTNPYLSSLYTQLGFESRDGFLFFLGVLFLILVVGSLAFRAFAFWVQVRFSQKRNHAWSCKLVEGYLNQPYEWFLNQHSSALDSSILNEVNRMVNGALFPSMQLVSQGLVTVFLLALMIAVDPPLALSVAGALGSVYVGLYLTVRRYLRRVGQDIQKTNRERFRVTREMFGGVKDVKVGGLESIFVKRFRQPSLHFAERQITARTVSELPSFAMQALVYGGIMVVLLYFLANEGNLQQALPMFSFYAFAGYRLLPALQAVYGHLSTMRVTAAVLDAVHRDLCDISTSTANPRSHGRNEVEPLGLTTQFELVDVSYSYPAADQPALRGVTLSIPARSTIGLVGPTGSGKTTLIDVMLGLLVPTRGSLLVDRKPVTSDTRQAWQRSIGYVPQQIYLADDTIAANVAFGIPEEEIDQTAVERAARVANLHDFVTAELPEGYATRVGESGVRLSGGQRQRIGIARALYHDPDMLIMDEATSALDNVTEQAVMQAVHNLGSRKTVVLIAHRLSTVRECDRIYYLEQGTVVAAGTYDELLEDNSKFRQLAGGID